MAKLLKSLKYYYKKDGMKGAVRFIMRKMAGLDQYEDQINTLYYILNTFCDATQMPPTKDPELRILQQCDALLLAIFDKLCQKYQLTYWIDFGTLLGATRHKGFIPWDDDMDISMPREDFDLVVEKLSEEAQKWGLNISEEIATPGRRCGFSYRHQETGIWLDIFPVDKVKSKTKRDDPAFTLSSRILNYKKQYSKYLKKHKDKVFFTELKKQIIPDEDGEYLIYYHGPEFNYKILVIHDEHEIFPLRTINFEGYSVNAPNDIHHYLSRYYGQRFMELPTSGALHHGGGVDRPPIRHWARLHGIDMVEVKHSLEQILLQIDNSCN